MSVQCKGDGSIQKLEANKWKTVGIGQLILLKNKHNPTHVLLKLIRKKRNEIYMFQCKLKVKSSGKSLILKGTDTKKKKESILSLRFNDSASMDQFHDILNEMYTETQSKTFKAKTRQGHARTVSSPPDHVKVQLRQYAWDCELCTFRNEPTTFDCEVCNHPRPLRSVMKKRHSKTDSINLDNLPLLFNPTSNNSESIDATTPNYDTHLTENGSSLILNTIQETKKGTEENEESKSESKSHTVDDGQKSTIAELISKIIHGERVAKIKPRLVEDILLLCHDTFTDSQTMLTTLLDQLCRQSLVDSTARMRGVKMCCSWMAKYWDDDFKADETMEDIMYKFIDKLPDIDLPESDTKLLDMIKNKFENQMNQSAITKKRQSTMRASAKFFGGIDVPKNYNIMEQKTQHIAEQITLMDFEIFRSIKKREMCGQGWKKKDRQQRSPHLLDMIAQFNSISKWVECVVLQQKTKSKRKAIIEKFIRIAVQLRELRNFSACCAINFGLNTNNVFRLKAAWAGVKKGEKKQYDEIHDIFQGKKNWALLRVFHQNAYAPSILHTGLFLQDLLNTDEGNEDTQKDGTVNFNKLKKTYTLIEQICMYQTSQYFNIKADHIMQGCWRQMWARQEPYNDDKMYKISKTVQTRDKEGKEISDADIALMAW